MKRGLQLPFKTSQKKNSTSPPKRKRQRERVFSGWNISRPKPFQTRLNFFSSQQIFLQSIKTFTSFFKHYFVFVLLLILILIQIQNDQRKKERKKERKKKNLGWNAGLSSTYNRKTQHPATFKSLWNQHYKTAFESILGPVPLTFTDPKMQNFYWGPILTIDCGEILYWHYCNYSCIDYT